MRVLLVTVTSTLENDEFIKPTVEQEGGYPIGVPYIESYLKSKGHIVEYLDFILIPYKKNKKILLNKIITFKPDVIGFSVLTGNHINTFRLVETIHELYPHKPIVLGGIHPTIMYEQILKKYPYVVVVIGEGEVTFSELLEIRILQSIKGIAFYHDGKVVKTENREPIEDLDILPFPSHSRLGIEGHKMANILTSRGCPNSCSFCVLNPNTKRKRRVRTAKNVLNEIEYIVKRYPNVKQIYFMDDAFLLDSNRVIEICKLIIERKLNYIEYNCQAKIKPFNSVIIPYLEEANITEIRFGLETANEEMLERCHKMIKQQDVIETVTKLKDSKINISMFLIIGLPGETKDTIIETAKFMQKIQKIKYIMYYDNQASILMVFPGTEVYKIMKSKGFIDDDYWLTHNSAPNYIVDFCTYELYELRDELFKRIAFMPIRLNKLKYQYDMIFNIIDYLIKKYKNKPLLLAKNFLKG